MLPENTSFPPRETGPEAADRAKRGHPTRESERDHLRRLLKWALPYCPEPTPSMKGGEYADNYEAAVSEVGGLDA